LAGLYSGVYPLPKKTEMATVFSQWREKQFQKTGGVANPFKGARVLERCKTCGKEYVKSPTMTYSEYGYCSWDCLMNKKSRYNNNNSHNNNNQNRPNRKNNGQRNYSGQRAKWA
jgi:hypothetical protein